MKIIKYKRMTEVNNGTEEEPNIVQIFDIGGIQCTDDNFDACYTAAQSRAYNGEVTVEDIPNEPTEPTQLDRIEAQTIYTAMMTDTLLEV